MTDYESDDNNEESYQQSRRDFVECVESQRRLARINAYIWLGCAGVQAGINLVPDYNPTLLSILFNPIMTSISLFMAWKHYRQKLKYERALKAVAQLEVARNGQSRIAFEHYVDQVLAELHRL